MKRLLLNGGMVMGLAVVGSLTIAEPGQAQKPPFPNGVALEGTVSAQRVGPIGEQPTFTG